MEFEETKVAVLVDGGFYRRRYERVKGEHTPQEAANDLYNYCQRHLVDKKQRYRKRLYRIFYYDCPPMTKKMNHPFDNEFIDFSKSPLKKWTDDFFSELSHKRKVALRLGELSESFANFNLKPHVSKKIANGSMTPQQIKKEDFVLNVTQKGVDMKIGIDIITLAYKQQVDEIILIAGDSDFVPAAKTARREGIDFVLDPLGNKIKDSLALHIDGLRTCDKSYLQPPAEKRVKEKIEQRKPTAAELRWRAKIR